MTSPRRFPDTRRIHLRISDNVFSQGIKQNGKDFFWLRYKSSILAFPKMININLSCDPKTSNFLFPSKDSFKQFLYYNFTYSCVWC